MAAEEDGVQSRLLSLVRSGHYEQARSLCDSLSAPLDLSGVDLSDADLRRAKHSPMTRWPEGFDKRRLW